MKILVECVYSEGKEYEEQRGILKNIFPKLKGVTVDSANECKCVPFKVH